MWWALNRPFGRLALVNCNTFWNLFNHFSSFGQLSWNVVNLKQIETIVWRALCMILNPSLILSDKKKYKRKKTRESSHIHRQKMNLQVILSWGNKAYYILSGYCKICIDIILQKCIEGASLKVTKMVIPDLCLFFIIG